MSYHAQFLAVTSKVSCNAWFEFVKAFITACAIILINDSINSSKQINAFSFWMDINFDIFILFNNNLFITLAILERISKFSSSTYENHILAISLLLKDLMWFEKERIFLEICKRTETEFENNNLKYGRSRWSYSSET